MASRAWNQSQHDGAQRISPASRARGRSFDVRIAVLAVAFLLSMVIAGSPAGFVLVFGRPLILVFVATIIADGVLMARVMDLPTLRALALSLWTTLGAVLSGFIVALVFAMTLRAIDESFATTPETRLGATVLLVPYLFFCWAVKYRVFAKRAGTLLHAKIFRTTGLTSMMSYGAMLAIVWTMSGLYTYTSFYRKVHMHNALRGAEGLQGAAGWFQLTHGRFPDRLEELEIADLDAIDTGYARIRLGPEGRIDVELQMPDEPKVHGKRLILTPEIVGDGEIRWTCTAQQEIRPFAPASCKP